MKNNSIWKRLLTFILAVLLCIPGSAGCAPTQSTGQTSEPDNSLAASPSDDVLSSVPTESVPANTEPEITEPEITEPPATEPEITEPVNTEPVSTELAVTEPVSTKPVETEPPATEPPAESEPSPTAPAAQPTLPPIGDPSNWSSVYVGTAEQEEAARKVAKQIADSIGPGTDLERIQKATELVSMYKQSYRADKNIYMTAYSVFVLRESCCWGHTSALGMVLDYMGYTWRRGNNGVDELIDPQAAWAKHQWVIVNMDGHVGYADAQNNMAYYGSYGGGRDYSFPKSHGDSCSETILAESTCTKDGAVFYFCSVCGESVEYTTAALGHDSTVTEAVLPTDSERGYTVYSCKRCGEVYNDDYTYTLKSCEENERNHDWVKSSWMMDFGKCSLCGASEEPYRRQYCMDGSGNHYWLKFGASDSMYCRYCMVMAPIDWDLIHDATP